MSNRAWMPLHIDDYLADTGHLTGAEHGAYMLMIMHYWQNGRLPENERLIARLARMDVAQWEESRDVLAMLFGPNWTHKRIDAELAKADEIIEKRRSAANARHQRSTPGATAMQMQSKCTDTGALPLTDNLSEKEEPSGSSKKRAVRLKPDWNIPEAWLQEAIDAGMPRTRALSEAERMKNWSLGSKSGVKLDWLATWRNWFRDKLDQPTPRSASPPRTGGVSGAAQRIMEGERNGTEGIFGRNGDAQFVSAASGGGSRNALEDLRGGVGRQFISIDH